MERPSPLEAVVRDFGRPSASVRRTIQKKMTSAVIPTNARAPMIPPMRTGVEMPPPPPLLLLTDAGGRLLELEELGRRSVAVPVREGMLDTLIW